MILNRQRAVRVARRPLEQFLQRVEREFGLRPEDLTVCFVSDAEIARMNAAYRKKKGPTDVLSFPAKSIQRASPRKSAGLKAAESVPAVKERGRTKRRTRSYLGDIAIAPETARRYAKKNGRGVASELRMLILHGILHLLGYDHETDQGQMDRIEQKLRRRFGLR